MDDILLQDHVVQPSDAAVVLCWAWDETEQRMQSDSADSGVTAGLPWLSRDYLNAKRAGQCTKGIAMETMVQTGKLTVTHLGTGREHFGEDIVCGLRFLEGLTAACLLSAIQRDMGRSLTVWRSGWVPEPVRYWALAGTPECCLRVAYGFVMWPPGPPPSPFVFLSFGWSVRWWVAHSRPLSQHLGLDLGVFLKEIKGRQ